MNANIVYRDIDDKELISFCMNNITENVKLILGVFVDTDGKVKVAKESYPDLVKLYLEAGAMTNGVFDILIDADFPAQTDTLM